MEIQDIRTVMTGIREITPTILLPPTVVMEETDLAMATVDRGAKEPLAAMAAAVGTQGRPVVKAAKGAVAERQMEMVVPVTVVRAVEVLMGVEMVAVVETPKTVALVMEVAGGMPPVIPEAAMAVMAVTHKQVKAAMVVVAALLRRMDAAAMAQMAAMVNLLEKGVLVAIQRDVLGGEVLRGEGFLGRQRFFQTISIIFQVWKILQ